MESTAVDGDAVDGVLFNTSHLVLPGQTNGLPSHLYADNNCDNDSSIGGGGDYVDGDGSTIKVYNTRFWILALFSFVALFQCMMWNTWGPLSASMNAAFPGWGSDTVAMMGNWGTITFVVFVVPMCWLMNDKGLRVGALACGGLIAAGTVLRIVPLLVTDNLTFFTVMCHACAILVGTAGTLIMAAPPMIAAVWFPPQERTTATAFAQMMNQLGNAGSFMEPLLVREPSSSHPSHHEVTEIQDDIKNLMYIWAGVGVGLLLLLIIHFPAKPEIPPSLTSHVERLNLMESLKKIVKNRDLLLVTSSYAISIGTPSAWTAVMNYSFYELGLSQDQAMWVGQASIISCAISALVVGRFTDIFYGYIKLSIIIFMALSSAFFFWFFLLTWGSITLSTWQIYASVVGGMSFNFAMSPLFFELAVENAYPCSEVIVGGILTGCNNFVGLCFFFLFFIPVASYEWVTYVLVGSLAVSLIPLAFIREDYSRSAIDRQSPYPPI